MTVENLEIKVSAKGVTAAANRFNSLAESIERVEAAGGKMSGGTNSTAKAMNNVAKAATKANKPLGNFISSLKRIAFYRVIRSIIKSITQAFQEGLQWAYQFSSGVEGEGHRFAAALDSMKTAGTTMKAQLGSAFIGLLAAIAPVVNAIISLVTKLANILSQLFAVFTGGTYLKAAEVPQKWADAASGAAGAAKEWKNQLLGFDEINRLEEPSNSGGDEGGGIDPMSMFEDAEIDGVFKRIKEKFDEFKKSLNLDPLKESFEKLKTAISGALSRIGDAISRIWEKALAPFIKWVIEELLPTNLDTITAIIEIANAIYDVLSPAIDFIWDNVLSPLARWLGNSFISSLKRINEILHEFARLINGEISFADFINNLFGIEKMINNLKTVWGKFKEAVSNAWAAITEKAPGAQRAMIEFAVAIASRFNAVVSALQTVFGWIRNIISIAQNAIAWLGGVISLSGHMQGTTISGQYGGSHSSGKFADGGFPESGQLFIAREDGAGAELVGAIGGRTAVASNQDILEGIRQGVYEAVVAANGSGDRDVSVKVYLDSREIKAGQRRLAYATGV